MSTTEEYVLAGKNNDFKLLIELDEVPIDFDTATRFVLTLTDEENEREIVIDTDTNAGAIAGDSVGIVTFIIGLLVDDTQKGLYDARLCVYDPLHVEGQVLVDWCATGLPNLSVMIC